MAWHGVAVCRLRLAGRHVARGTRRWLTCLGLEKAFLKPRRKFEDHILSHILLSDLLFEKKPLARYLRLAMISNRVLISINYWWLRQCEESILVGKFKSCTEIRTMRSHQRVCISYHHSLNILVKDPKSESDLLARKLLQGCRQTLRRRMKGRPYNRAKGNAWFRLLSWRFAATPNVGWSLSLALCSALLQGSSTSIMRKLSTSQVESIGLQPYYCGSQIVHLQVFWLLCCFFGVGHDLQLKVFLLVLQLRAFPSI